MHKPIVSVDLSPDSSCTEGLCVDPVDRADDVEHAQRINLLSAVSASMLMYDATKNERHLSSLQSLPISQLYNTIASISYTGDFRMQTGAEDPNKVKKLVEAPGMRNLWDDMYSETLGQLNAIGLISVVNPSRTSGSRNSNEPNGDGERHLECNFFDPAIRKQLMQNLPQRLQRYSDQCIGSESNADSVRQGSLLLRQELANIVAPAAKSQSMKGFFTAGFSKSLRYVKAKMMKGKNK